MSKKLGIVLSIALCISLCANLFAVKMAKADDPEKTAETETVAAAEENVADEMRYIIASDNGEAIKALDCDSNEIDLSEVPVSVKITYTLDGAEVTESELSGKSGHIGIRYDFTNLSKSTQKIGDEETDIYVPYACVTSLLLDDKKVSNVTVSSGKVIDDGNRRIVIGLAFPGLQEDIDLDTEKIDIPGHVEVEFDATDFEKTTGYIIASGNLLNDLDLKEVNADDLKEDMEDIKEAMNDLMDGAVKLTEGFDTFDEGLKTYTDGVTSLSDGLDTLSSNNAKLNAGAKQIFDSILDTANDTLKASGLDVPALTAENYAKVLDNAAASLDPSSAEAMAKAQVESKVRENTELIKTKVTAAVKEQVKAGVEAAMQGADEATIAAYTEGKMASDEVTAMIEAKTEEQIQALIAENLNSDEVKAQIEGGKAQMKKGAESLTALKAKLDSVNTFYTGVISYTDGVKKASDGAKTLKESSSKLTAGAGDLKDGASKLSDGLNEFNEKAIEKLVSLVDEDLAGYADRINAIRNAATENTDKNNYVFKIN